VARRNKGEEKRMAVGRIGHLLDEARGEALGPDADLADRHAGAARRIAMRYQVRGLDRLTAEVCRGCGAYRVAGRTSRTRVQRGRVVTTCLACGRVRRRPLPPSEVTA
jgi:ribonuclease P protein subunit RPR2